MVDIAPFRGLFFNEKKAGKISKAISPPYDVISPTLKDRLYNSSNYNIINLTLPEGKTPDKYIRARELLSDWINKKILTFDNDKSFYIFEENFSLNGKIKKISAFIGLTRLEPYSSLKIMPHEKTSPSVKRDRLNLLSECRTNFGLVFTIYNDSHQEIKNIMETKMKNDPLLDIKPDYDTSLNFRLWKVSDSETINSIVNIMKERKLIIADGHHRYETSLQYKKLRKKTLADEVETDGQRPEDYILTLYVDINQNDFLILPTHRVIKFHNYPGIEEFISKISNNFNIEEVKSKSATWINEELLKLKSKGFKSFFIYSREQKTYLVTFKQNNIDSIVANEKTTDSNYSNLDINILQKFITEHISNWYKIKNINYSCSTDEIISEVNSKKYDIGIFLNAPTAKELEKICEAGYLMPEKSTYFHPKPCSGLVMYRFDL